ncbi:hypothetical protein CaCOL14_010290 [Colletotrichum acutatum]
MLAFIPVIGRQLMYSVVLQDFSRDGPQVSTALSFVTYIQPISKQCAPAASQHFTGVQLPLYRSNGHASRLDSSCDQSSLPFAKVTTAP